MAEIYRVSKENSYQIELLAKLKGLKQRRHGMHPGDKREILDKEIASVQNKIKDNALKQ